MRSLVVLLLGIRLLDACTSSPASPRRAPLAPSAPVAAAAPLMVVSYPTTVTAELAACERSRKPGCDNPCVEPLIACYTLAIGSDGAVVSIDNTAFHGFDGCHWRCGSWRVWEGCNEAKDATTDRCDAPDHSRFPEGPH